MKKILIISTYYPPIKSIASNRIFAFAKYFREANYDVTVVTRAEKLEQDTIENDIHVIRLKDTGIGSGLDTNKVENKVVHYLKCAYNMLMTNFQIDVYAGWTKKASKVVLKLLECNQYEYILSSAPPIGPHCVAAVAKTQYPEIVWIADMRDALSFSKHYSPRILKKLRRYEQLFLEKCDILTSVSYPQLQQYKSNARKYAGKKFLEIRNGYDFPAQICKKKTKIFSILYAGNFYGERKPNSFFRALENILNKYQIEIRVRILGNSAPIKIPSTLQSIVSLEDGVTYSSLIEEMRYHADALLLISPSSLEKGIYTGKLFDYIGACTPILGLVPETDVAAELIREAHIGYVAANENISAIEKIILQAYYDWEHQKIFAPNMEIVKKHHRRNQVHRLIESLNSEKWV